MQHTSLSTPGLLGCACLLALNASCGAADESAPAPEPVFVGSVYFVRIVYNIGFFLVIL